VLRLLRFALVFLLTPTLPAASVALFDGKTLEGWTYNEKIWRLENGMITGGSLEERVPRNEFIATKKSFHNFELRVTIKLTGTDGFVNSGIVAQFIPAANGQSLAAPARVTAGSDRRDPEPPTVPSRFLPSRRWCRCCSSPWCGTSPWPRPLRSWLPFAPPDSTPPCACSRRPRPSPAIAAAGRWRARRHRRCKRPQKTRPPRA
ncbi:MAG: DUF1080 domain-containing protein, partial [Verrucomicrobia bacterium]|nr:DUF1080 domain-containing protein [Verrucomicrobiota bacterium]